MLRTFSALAAAALAGGALSAHAAEGRFGIENRGSTPIVLTVQTGQWSSEPPRRLEAGGDGAGTLHFADKAVVVNHLSYREPGSIRSCSFRIQTEPGTPLCRVVAVALAGGGASCHYRFTERDSKTCDFEVVFTLSGF